MTRTKRTTGTLLMVAVLTGLTAVEVVAQRGARRGPTMRGGDEVEAVMRMRDRLELTEEQIGQLEAIRRERVEERAAADAELAEMRSRVAAGQAQPSELMALMEQRREANSGVAERRRARIDGLLDEGQRTSLQQMRERSAFQRGRMSARGGDRAAMGRGRTGVRDARGMRGVRDGARGMRSGRDAARGGRSGFRGARRPGGDTLRRG